MATFTINTTAKEDAAISFMVNQVNAQRAAQIDPNTGLPPPPIGPQALIKTLVEGQLISWFQASRDDNRVKVATAYEAATPAGGDTAAEDVAFAAQAMSEAAESMKAQA